MDGKWTSADGDETLSVEVNTITVRLSEEEVTWFREPEASTSVINVSCCNGSHQNTESTLAKRHIGQLIHYSSLFSSCKFHSELGFSRCFTWNNVLHWCWPILCVDSSSCERWAIDKPPPFNSPWFRSSVCLCVCTPDNWLRHRARQIALGVNWGPRDKQVESGSMEINCHLC